MCPIEVIGTPSYTCAVELALGKICHGVKLAGCAPDPDGVTQTCTVDVSGVGCSDYCARRVGCNLIRLVAEASDTPGKELTIEDGGFMYFHLLKEIWWENVSAAVDWCTICGKPENRELHPVPMLAHELIHAYHDIVVVPRTYRTNSYPPWTEEACTVCGENQIRDEHADMKRRCTYGTSESNAECIKCGPALYSQLRGHPTYYDCRLIPNESMREDCSCGLPCALIWEGGLAYVFREIGGYVEYVVSRLSHVARLVFPRPPRPGLPDPRGARARSTGGCFDSQLPADPELKRAFEHAIESLVAGRGEWSDPSVEDAFEEASDAIMLEIVPLSGGYRVLMMALDANAVTLVTNIRTARDELGFRLGSQGDLTRYELPEARGDLTDLVREDKFWVANATEATVRLVSDGETNFLRVKSEGRLTCVAVQGFPFPRGPRAKRVRPPEREDALRWDAVRRAREAVADQVGELRTPGTVLRPSGLDEESAPR